MPPDTVRLLLAIGMSAAGLLGGAQGAAERGGRPAAYLLVAVLSAFPLAGLALGLNGAPAWLVMLPVFLVLMSATLVRVTGGPHPRWAISRLFSHLTEGWDRWEAGAPRTEEDLADEAETLAQLVSFRSPQTARLIDAMTAYHRLRWDPETPTEPLAAAPYMYRAALELFDADLAYTCPGRGWAGRRLYPRSRVSSAIRAKMAIALWLALADRPLDASGVAQLGDRLDGLEAWRTRDTAAFLDQVRLTYESAMRGLPGNLADLEALRSMHADLARRHGLRHPGTTGSVSAN